MLLRFFQGMQLDVTAVQLLQRAFTTCLWLHFHLRRLSIRSLQVRTQTQFTPFLTAFLRLDLCLKALLINFHTRCL